MRARRPRSQCASAYQRSVDTRRTAPAAASAWALVCLPACQLRDNDLAIAAAPLGRRLHRRPVPLTAFALLCAITGAGVANALLAPLALGAAVGLAIGTVPAWVPRVAPGQTSARWGEHLSLAVLIAIAAAISASALAPVLSGGAVELERYLALLLIAPAFYWTYLALNRSRAADSQASVLDRLAAALSGPPLLLALALAVTVATCALLLIHYVGLNYPAWQGIAAKFLERGVIPPLTVVLFCWGLLLLANKTWVLWREQRLLKPLNSRSALASAHAEARRGAVPVDDFIDMVWKKSADFYVVPRYINWAIPILGFIGTVLGISLAADGIQDIVGARGGLGDLSSELGDAIAPLGIAFDTTLIALSLSVLLTLLQTALQRWEDGLLVAYESRVRAGTPAHAAAALR